MLDLNIASDIRKTEPWLKRVQKKAVPKASSIAINWAATTVRKESVREAIAISLKARCTHLVAVVKARPKGKRVPGSFRRKAGVSANP